LVERGDQLARGPCLDRTGSSSRQAARIHFENRRNLTSIGIKTPLTKPSNGIKILKKLLKKAQQLPEDIKKTLNEQPCQLIPVRIGGMHAFSLMLGHPSLRDFWSQILNTQKKTTTDEMISHWINTHTVNPGKAVANERLSEKSRSNLIKFIMEKILETDKHEAFTLKIQTLRIDLSPKQFRKALITILNPLITQAEDSMEVVEETIDTALCSQLLPNLTSGIIVFADSNWSKGVRDIHYCFLVNQGLEILKCGRFWITAMVFYHLNRGIGAPEKMGIVPLFLG